MTGIGEQIRRARKAAGLGLRQTAARAFISPGYLCQIEHGERVAPSSEVLARLSVVLGVEPTRIPYWD